MPLKLGQGSAKPVYIVDPVTKQPVIGSAIPVVIYDSNGIAMTLTKEYGEICTVDGSAAQSGIDSTPQKLTGFSNDGINSLNITPDYTNNQITVNIGGIFFIAFSCSFIGGANTEYEMHLAINGVIQNEGLHRKISGVDVGSASFVAIKSLNALDVITALVSQPTGSSTVTLRDAQLTIHQV